MERIPYRKTYEVVGYTFEADTHCIRCTATRFGEDALKRRTLPIDNEGNPIHPLFLEETTDDTASSNCRRRLNE